MTKFMIEVDGLVKRFGKLHAVNHLSFHVKSGEIFGFLGPNGAGKTTTMKMIAGLLRPTEGKILVGGLDIQKEPIKVKQQMGYIPDRPFIYEKLTGKEFLHFVAGLYHMEKKDYEERALSLLESFELLHMCDEMVENYSHGMKQRITMAAAFIHRPKLIIVDEPMVGLDPRGSLLIRRIFRGLCEKEGVAIFLSTHTLSIAEEVCDRIGIIYKGKLIALGTLEELRERAAAGNIGLEEIFLRLTEGVSEPELLLPPELRESVEQTASVQ